MTFGDRIKQGVQDATGKAKQASGKAIDDERPEAEGEGDQVSAEAKQSGDRAADSAKSVGK